MRTTPLMVLLAGGAAIAVTAVGVAIAVDDVATPTPIELSAVPADQAADTDQADDAPSGDSTDATADDPPAGDATDTADDPASATIDEDDARRIALEEVGGEVIHVRADRDDGRPEWELLVRDERDVLVEVTLDANDGRVLEIDVEDDDLDDRGQAIVHALDEADATSIALDATGGGEVVHATASYDDGQPEWEVLVRDDRGDLVEVTIDGSDGRVLEVDAED